MARCPKCGKIIIDAAGALEAHLVNCPKKDTPSPARAQ
jgi:phage FluMu protein Com